MSNILLWTNQFKHQHILCTLPKIPVFSCISLTRWGKIYWLQNARILCRKSDRNILSTGLVYPLKEKILDYFYTVHSSSGERFSTRNILPLQPNSQYGFSRLQWTPRIPFFLWSVSQSLHFLIYSSTGAFPSGIWIYLLAIIHVVFTETPRFAKKFLWGIYQGKSSVCNSILK